MGDCLIPHDLPLKSAVGRQRAISLSSGRKIAWNGTKNHLKIPGRVQIPPGRYPKDRRFLLAIQDVTYLYLP
jgi:hypothetical protein